eukprot:3076004-Rhodomonas_salina.2
MLDRQFNSDGIHRIYFHCRFLEPSGADKNGYPHPTAGANLKAAFPQANEVVLWSVATNKLASFMMAVLDSYFAACQSADIDVALQVSAKDVQYGKLFDNLGEWAHGATPEPFMEGIVQRLKTKAADQTVVMIWDEAAAMSQRRFLVQDDRMGDSETTPFQLSVRPVSAPTHCLWALSRYSTIALGHSGHSLGSLGSQSMLDMRLHSRCSACWCSAADTPAS